MFFFGLCKFNYIRYIVFYLEHVCLFFFKHIFVQFLPSTLNYVDVEMQKYIEKYV